MEELGFNITVVGLGLIGGSYAMALKELKPKNLWAVDIDEKALLTGEKMGIIDKGFPEAEAWVPLKNSDLVIICLYPELTVKFVKDNINNFKPGSLITDTAGIKEKVIEEINSFLRDDLDFIAGHPLAGKECQGLEYASKDIFAGANYILTPTARNKEENLELIEEIVRRIGCKRVARVSAAKHDEIIALTSQLPHVIAAALVNSVVSGDTGMFTGGSFRDATRVARINSRLWTELLLENSEYILEQIRVFQENVNRIKVAIENRDRASLESFLERASAKREELL